MMIPSILIKLNDKCLNNRKSDITDYVSIIIHDFEYNIIIVLIEREYILFSIYRLIYSVI